MLSSPIARAGLLATLLLGGCRSTPDTPLRERMLAAEDSRASAPGGVAALEEGLASSDADVRRQAVRAIGRLERPDLARLAEGRLSDGDPSVRAQAADALAQLSTTPAAAASAAGVLLARLGDETDPGVRGALAASAGRLPLATAAEVTRVGAALAALLPSGADASVPPAQAAGAARGLEALVRQRQGVAPPSPDTLARLRAAAQWQGPAGGEQAPVVRTRRLALLALAQAEAVDGALLAGASGDADAEVRRIAAAAAGAMPDLDGRDALLRAALGDRNPQVRYEALRGWGRRLQASDCGPVTEAVADSDPHVALLAIDRLGEDCPGGPSPAGVLRSLTDGPTPEPGAWHRAAHALVSLARISPAEARKRLMPFASSRIWQVRMWAARAATTLAALDELERLARDVDDNVRNAALTGLVALDRPEAGPIAIDALSRPDYQLVMTAAGALGDPALADRSVPALVDALARLTAEGKDTSRDPRMAILERLDALGGAEGRGLFDHPIARPLPEALRPYLNDFDPAVAARAAALIGKWTGTTPAASPRPAERPPVSLAAIDALAGKVLRLEIAGRGTIDIRLLLDEAPLSALRVATRAGEGYYDGLTFHRVVPNFVLQGGSPGANEYMGDARYKRDEVGLVSHNRGTVGISTRGRD
ncbi:MAG: HEAT repeat domain-containing protein, partial [Vicinamibacterales bacterium]